MVELHSVREYIQHNLKVKIIVNGILKKKILMKLHFLVSTVG